MSSVKSQSRKVYKIKIRKGDRVIIRSGRWRGQSGRVSAIHPQTNQISVEGLNMVKRHLKPSLQHPQGGIVEQQRPFASSKVAILDPDSKKPSKIAYKIVKGQKQRIYQRSQKVITSKALVKSSGKKKGAGK